MLNRLTLLSSQPWGLRPLPLRRAINQRYKEEEGIMASFWRAASPTTSPSPAPLLAETQTPEAGQTFDPEPTQRGCRNLGSALRQGGFRHLFAEFQSGRTSTLDADALPETIDRISATGYGFVTLDELTGVRDDPG